MRTISREKVKRTRCNNRINQDNIIQNSTSKIKEISEIYGIYIKAVIVVKNINKGVVVMTIKYLIKAKINPIKKTIHSEVNIQFNEIHKDTIEFYLHKNLKIEEIVDSNQEVKFEENFEEKPLPYLPESKRYILTSKIQGSSIKIKYNGVIDKIEDIEINQISEDFIELNVYSPWYPLLTTLPIMIVM